LLGSEFPSEIGSALAAAAIDLGGLLPLSGEVHRSAGSSESAVHGTIEDRSLVDLENAGERMVPEVSGEHTFWEHVYRYAFACRFVRKKRVLDIACGEGYGAEALRRAGATQVIGVDISADVCRHARHKYGLDACAGSAEQIPLPNRSVDVVVSFETIEHIRSPLRFLDECVRVLTPGGRLVISTPNKETYSASRQFTNNPYHCSEMTKDEFLSALNSGFHNIKLYSQHPHRAPWWSIRLPAADEAPWSRLPLFKRLYRIANFRLALIIYGLSSEQRRMAVEHILRARRRNYSVLIPYALRPFQSCVAEQQQPFYFVATANSRSTL
jgi:2-polyprenyl-3-methyl-5-hydroxy-6-metoxy-1,4-benzoquinol methylase